MSELTYAKGGETPGWQHLHVVDCATGQEITGVAEVDVVAGYLIQFKPGVGGQRIRERLEGKFKIVSRPPQDH